MTNSKVAIDPYVLHQALDVARQHRNLDWQQVAAQTGLHPSFFTRLKHGHPGSSASVAALLVWAGLDARSILAGRVDLLPGLDTQYVHTVTAVHQVLRRDPLLRAEQADTVAEVVRSLYEHFVLMGAS